MPRERNQKMKLSVLSNILREKTDEEHGLTTNELISLLARQGISANRQTIYNDIETLQGYGMDVIKETSANKTRYHMGRREFELAELKLLVDAIQASKFITEKKSRELIKKIANLASIYEAEQLKRQVVVQGRIKSMNESIYYVVDQISTAIRCNERISFIYLRWNKQKKLVPKRDERYEVSPWNLVWDSENYYLIAYDYEAKIIKHYRVDKMKCIELVGRKREGEKEYKRLDLGAYSRQFFSMYHGEIKRVKIKFNADIVGVIIDRFGRDIIICDANEKGWLETNVEVAVSKQFYGWVFGLGGDLKIVGPEEVVTEYETMKRGSQG